MSDNASPIFAIGDLPNRAFVHAELASERAIALLSGDASFYLADLRRREFGAPVTFAMKVGSVSNLVSFVFDRKRPSQMLWVNAPKMPISAVVSGLMPRGWTWAVNEDANGPTRRSCPELLPVHNRVSLGAPSVGPQQTVVSGVCDGHRNEVIADAVNNLAELWIAGPMPAVVVDSAPPTSRVRLAAAFDAAYSLGSHALNLLRSALVRTRRGASTLGGFAFCTNSLRRVQA